MDNNQNPDQSFEDAFKQAYAPHVSSAQPLIPTPPQIPTQPAANTEETSHISQKLPILIGGIILAAAVLILGIVFQINQQSQAKKSIENEIISLDSEITQLYDIETEIFQKSGFSQDYYNAGQNLADKVLQKYTLEDELDSLKPATVFETNAIWFFVVAGVISLSSVIIFIFKN